jgi:hypothetical protein
LNRLVNFIIVFVRSIPVINERMVMINRVVI